MFRSTRQDLDGLAGWRSADVNSALLYAPDPECEEAIDYGVEDDCDCGVEFRGLKTELVVPIKGGCANGESGVAQCETYIGESM